MNITLTDPTSTYYKVANPVTITFDKKVSGTYTKFNASENTLVTIDPIETGISKYITPNGIDISSQEIDIWSTVTNVINESWTTITQTGQFETDLTNAINQLFADHKVPLTVISLDITLKNNVKTGFKEAIPITINFSDTITGTYQNFKIDPNDNKTLISITPIKTGINMYYDEDGNVVITSETLNKIYDIATKLTSKYWIYPTNNIANVPNGCGSNYDVFKSEIASEINSIPNFPLSLSDLSNTGAYLHVSDQQKATVNLSLSFLDKKTGQVVTNITIDKSSSNLNPNIDLEYYGGGAFVVLSYVPTGIPCVWLTQDFEDQLIPVVQNFIKTNFTSGWGDIDQTQLTNEVNNVMNQFGSATVNFFNYWGNGFWNPPSGFDTTYKWVKIGINFWGNAMINIAQSNEYLSTDRYYGDDYLLIWCQTSVPNQ